MSLSAWRQFEGPFLAGPKRRLARFRAVAREGRAQILETANRCIESLVGSLGTLDKLRKEQPQVGWGDARPKGFRKPQSLFSGERQQL